MWCSLGVPRSRSTARTRTSRRMWIWSTHTLSGQAQLDAMREIGFQEEGRYFRHPDSNVLVEFPPGPLAVGAEPVKEVQEIELATGTLKLISPTDCVKERLASYYHWGDRQALTQALLVVHHRPVDLLEVARWSEAVGKHDEFQEIRPSLVAARTK
jgi:hypothetical protein